MRLYFKIYSLNAIYISISGMMFVMSASACEFYFPCVTTEDQQHSLSLAAYALTACDL